ncbi:hypothetical protein [Paraflavitalea pollutisoli]|nr:hypothetical protein [Paraflavitalea sp. H1-2-19X]
MTFDPNNPAAAAANTDEVVDTNNAEGAEGSQDQVKDTEAGGE